MSRQLNISAPDSKPELRKRTNALRCLKPQGVLLVLGW